MIVGQYTNYCIHCEQYKDYTFAFVCHECQGELDHDFGPEESITLHELENYNG